MSLSQRKIVKNLFAKLQKKCKDLPVLPDEKRDFLDLLIFAALLENTSIENAYAAFSIMEHYFIDWNEVRVSTANDLAELFPAIQAPGKQSERIRRVLQWIFELQYNFDMNKVQGQNAETVLAFLQSIPFSTHFMNDLVMYILFTGRPLPFDEGAMRIFRLLECVEISQENKEIPAGMEVLKTKNDKMTFFLLLHELGAEFMKEDQEYSIRKFLKTIDPDAEFRAWIPLVDNNEIDDPVLIAKQVIKKERKRHLPSITIEADLDLDDRFDTNPLTEEDDYESAPDDIPEPVLVDDPGQEDPELKNDLSAIPVKAATEKISSSKEKSSKSVAGSKSKSLPLSPDNKKQKSQIEEKTPSSDKPVKKEKKDPNPSVSKVKKTKNTENAAPKAAVKTAKGSTKKETVKNVQKKSASQKIVAEQTDQEQAAKKSSRKITKETEKKTSPKKMVKAEPASASTDKDQGKKRQKKEMESEVKKLQRKKPR